MRDNYSASALSLLLLLLLVFLAAWALFWALQIPYMPGLGGPR